ncbi:MAG: LysR family transcriptional regulator [Rhizobiales bacterium]|nr:LysR family transcriptional regulator [Hyphomicrobiales bacterium]
MISAITNLVFLVNFNDLRVFLDVVDTGGMTQAASQRGRSQPGISRTIRDIEMRLGVVLFRRTGRGVDLTPAGERFLGFARATMEAFEAVESEVREIASVGPRELAVVVPLRTGRLLIPVLQKALTSALPDVEVHVYEDAMANMAQGLSQRKYDVAIAYAPPFRFEQRHDQLFRERLHLVGTSEAIAGEEATISLGEVAAMPLLLPNTRSTYRNQISSAFAEANLTPTIVRELETSEALLAFAGEGEGVAILPYSNVYREHEAGEIAVREIVSPPIERQVGLLFNRYVVGGTRSQVRSTLRDAMSMLAQRSRWLPIG